MEILYFQNSVSIGIMFLLDNQTADQYYVQKTTVNSSFPTLLHLTAYTSELTALQSFRVQGHVLSVPAHPPECTGHLWNIII